MAASFSTTVTLATPAEKVKSFLKRYWELDSRGQAVKAQLSLKPRDKSKLVIEGNEILIGEAVQSLVGRYDCLTRYTVQSISPTQTDVLIHIELDTSLFVEAFLTMPDCQDTFYLAKESVLAVVRALIAMESPV